MERIIGMTSQAGSREIRFVIKWQGCDEADLVPARVANAKCPQVRKLYLHRPSVNVSLYAFLIDAVIWEW